jgi:hypothetical protein
MYVNLEGETVMVELTFTEIKRAKIVGNKKINTKVGVNQVVREKLETEVQRNSVKLGGLQFVQTRKRADKLPALKTNLDQPQSFDLHTDLSQAVRMRLKGKATPADIAKIANLVATKELRGFSPSGS